MTESQLSIQSTKALELANRIALREQRSLADIVERALEAYDVAQTGAESASGFYARLARDCSADVDLEEVIREGRQPHRGPDL